MATTLFERFHDEPSAVADPYATGGLRPWDDYQFLQKGRKAGGGPPIGQRPPVLFELPIVSGTTVVGQTLHCTTGIWAGMPTLTFSYQWKRGATDVGGDSPNYLLVTADIGFLISCLVTAHRAVTSATAMSNVVGPVTAVVLPTAPINTEAPVASDNTVEGQIITSSDGLWTGTTPITYEYQWYYREPEVPTEPSVGVAPALTGSPYVDATLHCGTGTWSGTAPITYSYQWKRDGVNHGTDSADYLVLIGDLGATFTCTVTATNSVDTASANSSNSKGPIVEAPPAEVLTTEGVPLTVDGEDLTVTPDA